MNYDLAPQRMKANDRDSYIPARAQGKVHEPGIEDSQQGDSNMDDFDPFSPEVYGAEIVRTACQVYRTAPMAVLLELAEDVFSLIGRDISRDTYEELRSLIYNTHADRDIRILRERLITSAVSLGLNSPCAADPGGDRNEADSTEVPGTTDGSDHR